MLSLYSMSALSSRHPLLSMQKHHKMLLPEAQVTLPDPVSAATLNLRRSEVNSGQCTPIQPDSAQFGTFTYWGAPKFLPEQFLYIMDTPDSILVSVAAEMVAFQ